MFLIFFTIFVHSLPDINFTFQRKCKHVQQLFTNFATVACIFLGCTGVECGDGSANSSCDLSCFFSEVGVTQSFAFLLCVGYCCLAISSFSHFVLALSVNIDWLVRISLLYLLTLFRYHTVIKLLQI